jgi:hypothetical protein
VQASLPEINLLRRLWVRPINAVDHPEMAHVCPNCLAIREGKPTDGQHSSWCAIGREVKRLDEEARTWFYQI